MTISYAITVHDELNELKRLLKNIITCIRDGDEIVIQMDTTATEEVKEYLKNVPLADVIVFPLNKDFASFKNNLNKNCSRDYIFQIDADETVNEFLLCNLHEILSLNDIDVYRVPRINTVTGLTHDDILNWNWNVNEKNWVNFPDYQMRIYKNKPEIFWINKVHEVLTGYKTISKFPMDEAYCLYHPKDILRQRKQNDLYSNIKAFGL